MAASTTLDRVRILATLIRSPEARDAGVDIEYFAVSRGVIIEDENITISAFRTNHTTRPCFGYIFQERPPSATSGHPWPSVWACRPAPCATA